MSTTFKVGELTINRIIEQELPLFDPFEFFPTLTRELLDENRAWLEPTALDPATGNIIACIQSYDVCTPWHTILVDSCAGNNKPRPTRRFWNMKTDDAYMRGVAAVGLTVDDIDFVMCTHLHVDHVGWNTRLENGRWVPTFPKARYLFSEREYAYWSDRHAKEPIAPIEDSVLPVVAAKQVDFITSDHVLDDHVRLMPTPGHTPDHFAVLLGRGGKGAALTGDLIHSPLQARYPEMSMFADYDPKQAAVTRRNFLETMCEAGTLCCTAHFPSPSKGKFSRWGEGFRCDFV